MRTDILRLYKDLLRYGQNLRYTDKGYFHYRIRKAFQENKVLNDEKIIRFQLEKGRQVLRYQRVV